MVTVVLYGPVRDAVGEKRFSVDGETVADVIKSLSATHPVLGERVLSDGEIRGQVQVFVDGRKVGPLDGLETALDGVETVQITEAMSGG